MNESTPSPIPLRAVAVSKSFAGVTVLFHASLDLRAGEIHALVGENGAGKSTLLKLLAGVHRPDEGEVLVDEQRVRLTTPRVAAAHGIALIHQEPLVFPDLTVAENIFAAHQPRTRLGLVDWRAMYRRAAGILATLGVRIQPHTPMGALSLAEQQLVEIACALSQDVRVLLLDEPTAALSPGEAGVLFQVLRDLRARGVAIAFISHRLEEVFALAESITVLRDGAIVGQRRAAETSPEEILRLMVGRTMQDLSVPRKRRELGTPRLTVRALQAERRSAPLELEIQSGEIVGMAGLIGAGRSAVARALFGLHGRVPGSILVDGVPVRIRAPREAMAAGLALVPEDRGHQGGFALLEVWLNATMAVLSRLARFGWLSRAAARATAERALGRMDVRLRTVDQPLAELSGGNQQKVVLAKWLLTDPRVIILDEPTRGIDVAAKRDVHEFIEDRAAGGAAVLMISSDLNEILYLSDHVLVMREGAIVARLARGEATAERVMAAATGQ